MVYLEKIKIVNNEYPGSQVFKKNFEIICEDVNLLVGNQGCGKSTLLNLIKDQHSDIEISISDYTNSIKNGVNVYYFNSELDNPRTKDPELFTKPSGENIGIGYGAALSSRFQSHGEILERFIINPILKSKDCIILLDEPESGLSITNQFNLINSIKIAVDNGCQFFIATHCYPLIESFNVISLEHSKKMNGLEFIFNIKSDNYLT